MIFKPCLTGEDELGSRGLNGHRLSAGIASVRRQRLVIPMRGQSPTLGLFPKSEYHSFVG